MNRLGTKADTLEMLYRNQERFSVWGGVKILPQYTFTVAEWKEDLQKVEQAFLELTWNDAVIVRSSSLAEDTSENSQAGKYESIAGVSGAEEFRAAVEAVIASYDDEMEENQVLVQPMFSDLR